MLAALMTDLVRYAAASPLFMICMAVTWLQGSAMEHIFPIFRPLRQWSRDLRLASGAFWMALWIWAVLMLQHDFSAPTVSTITKAIPYSLLISSSVLFVVLIVSRLWERDG